MGLTFGDGLEVDHRNGNHADNRRENLRVVQSRSEQMQNTASHRGSTSQYRGVFWNTGKAKWTAKATVAGVAYHVGHFNDEREAAAAVAAFRAQHMTHSVEERHVA